MSLNLRNGLRALVRSSAPSNPASGLRALYPKSDGWYDLTSAGVETKVGPSDSFTDPGFQFLTPKWGVTTIDVVGVSGWSVTGTATAASWAATNYYTSTRHMDHLVTVASTSAVAGWRDTTPAGLWRGNASGLGGFRSVFRFGPATGVLSTSRMFTGLAASTTAPTDVNPSTLVSMIGVGYDAADTTLQIMHNDSAGTATKVNTGLTRVNTDRTKVYTLTISCLPNASTIDVTITDEAGTPFSTTISSADVPANNIALTPRSWCSVGGISSVVGIGVFGFYSETTT